MIHFGHMARMIGFRFFIPLNATYYFLPMQIIGSTAVIGGLLDFAGLPAILASAFILFE
jgi:hypothetical protein